MTADPGDGVRPLEDDEETDRPGGGTGPGATGSDGGVHDADAGTGVTGPGDSGATGPGGDTRITWSEVAAHAPGDSWFRRNWWVFVAGTIVPVAIILVALVIFTGNDDGSTATGTPVAGSTTTTGDFTELPPVDLATVTDSKFASLTMKQPDDSLKSYMFASGSTGFTELSEAVAGAEPIDGETGVTDTGTTLIFVTDGKGTVTLQLDLEHNRFGYAGEAWQPVGDLAAIVSQAVRGE